LGYSEVQLVQFVIDGVNKLTKMEASGWNTLNILSSIEILFKYMRVDINCNCKTRISLERFKV
jgi:hypothetical protein